MTTGAIFRPGRIGPVEVASRLVRAGTSETMAGPRGEVTDQLVALYETLARHQVPLMFTGHMYCEPRGRYAPRQTGIDRDDLIPGLARLPSAVHRHGGRIFAQLAHAGSQSLLPDSTPLAPSPVPNAVTGREVGEATVEAIESALDAFGAAARRAMEAGFDGVHVHGANGYLIAEFSSPVANRRTDGWGGTAAGRDRFALEVARRVRAQVPGDRAVTMKLGFVDAVPGGLTLDESVRRAGRLVEAGVDGFEVSSNVMRGYVDSARPYVAVGGRRALRDWLLHRVFRAPAPEAYFRPWARALRARVATTIVLVGGLRRAATIAETLASGDADFVSLARPFIRQPDLVRRLAGGAPIAECTSCNLCLMHEGHHALRCWRTPRRRLVEHALYRLTGGFGRGSGVQPREMSVTAP
jgi:2,4-dienoyl-CoA reductase-like NADH-dependent reductase (Old Yellow Enzyme family)